jgi:CobQ-like glutamine amidotransferase family enzyme
MSIKLVSLFPKHLDLNGDQANLLVLAKRLQWRGVAADIVAVDKGQSIPNDAALIFLGHGSMAAWADIEFDLNRLLGDIRQLVADGAAFMAVATGHERAINLGLLGGPVNPSSRISRFEIAEFEDQEILGYLNSATDAPTIQKRGLLLGTQLHGPVFAKNPTFADSYLAEIAKSRGVEFIGAELNTNSSLVAGIVSQVWELERELASE